MSGRPPSSRARPPSGMARPPSGFRLGTGRPGSRGGQGIGGSGILNSGIKVEDR